MSFLFKDIDNNSIYNHEQVLNLSSQYAHEFEKIEFEKSPILILCHQNMIVHFLAAFLAAKENIHFLILSKTNETFLPDQFKAHFQKIVLLKDINLSNDHTHRHTQYKQFKQYKQHKKISDISSSNATIWTKSSGSSGDAKFIGHLFKNIKYSVDQTFDFLEKQNINLNNIKDINWLMALPCDHIGGLMILFRAWINQFTITKIDNLKTVNFTNDNLNNLPNFASFVPTQLFQMIENKNCSNLIENLKVINLSGAKIEDQHLHLFTKYLKNISLFCTYGATETCSQVAGNIYDSLQIQNLIESNECLEYRPFKNVTLNQGEKKTYITSPSNCYIIFNDQFSYIQNHTVELFDSIDYPKNQSIYFQIQSRTDKTVISGGKNINLDGLKIKIIQILTPLLQDNFQLSHFEINLIGVKDTYWGERVILFIDISLNFSMLESKNQLIKKIFDEMKKSQILLKEEIPKNIYLSHLVNQSRIKPSFNELVEYHHLNQYHWVFFHGFMGDTSDFTEFIKCGPQRIESYQCIDMYQIAELTNAPYQIETINELINESIINGPNRESQKPIVFLGYSMGARVMLSYLLSSYPAPEKYFVISSHLGDMLNENDKTARIKSDQNLLANIKNDNEFGQFIDNWYQQSLFTGIETAQCFSILKKSKQYKKIKSYQKLLEKFSVGFMPNFSEYLKGKEDLIKFVTGDLDEKYSLYASESKYKHKIIKGHSHALLFEAPSKTKESIISLINGDIHP